MGVQLAVVQCSICCGCHCFIIFMLCRQKHFGTVLLSGTHANLASLHTTERGLQEPQVEDTCAVLCCDTK